MNHAGSINIRLRDAPGGSGLLPGRLAELPGGKSGYLMRWIAAGGNTRLRERRGRITEDRKR